MKRSFLSFVVALAALLSCSPDGKEAASEYYDKFSDIVVPYKDGTERILGETQALLQKELDASGTLKLSPEDSLRQRQLFQEFESLASAAMKQIHELDTFPGSDLKSKGVEYIHTSSHAILGAFRDVALPMQDAVKPPNPRMIDSLSNHYADALMASNERFASGQLEFLKKFDLMSLSH